jgi:ribonucleotide reductase alpha subunit
LNRIIDNNYYPIPEARTSNMRHRPIGIGIQGMADTLIKMRVAFEDPRAEEINA